MKKMKKFAALFLALVMVFSLAAAVSAAEGDETTYSITINNSAEGHTYEAYQIFKGDLNEGVLSNVVWGDSVANAADLDDAASVAERLDEAYTGSDKLSVEDLLDMITLGDKVADSGNSSNPYVIEGLVAGYYLVKDQDGSLAGKDDAYTEYIIKVVGDVITSPKADVPEVEKKVKDTNDSTGDTSDWQDSADHDINDTVEFQLKATLANNVSTYDTYKIVFHDSLSDGLTYNDDAVVYFNGSNVTAYFTITEENGELTISCDDVKAFGATDSSVITVEYTATLNENAVLGAAGNPNTVYLEYSNKPNWDGEGDTDEDTGETPEDTVIVFTYKVIVNKIDADGEPVTGAEFTLEKYNAETESWEAIAVVKNDAGTTFTFSGLDDGDYRLTETKTPAGYNTIEPIEFTVTAEHDIVSDDPRLTALNGGDLFTGHVDTGALEGDVVNQKGATLPETGGVGTTIFYTVGGLMVLAAVILLVTKRRMAQEG